MTEDDILNAYLTWLGSWASPNTIRARKIVVGRVLRDHGLDGFTPQRIQEFLARPELTSRWSKSTYHAHLTSFSEWAVTAGLIQGDPMQAVRRTTPPKGRPRPLTESDVARVLDTATGRQRDWVMIALLTGLRASEIAALRGEHVQADGLYVLGKGDVEATLPTHPDMWELAQRYPRRGFWFPGNDRGHVPAQNISLAIGRLFRRLGIEGSIHRCRHTYGTRLLRAGVHVRRVQQLMRHAKLETTANYTAVDEDELRDAILLLPSLL